MGAVKALLLPAPLPAWQTGKHIVWCVKGLLHDILFARAAGWVGFERDMGATNTLAADSAGAAMDATAAAMEEIELRSRDPLREYRIWNKARLPRPILYLCFLFCIN